MLLSVVLRLWFSDVTSKTRGTLKKKCDYTMRYRNMVRFAFVFYCQRNAIMK